MITGGMSSTETGKRVLGNLALLLYRRGLCDDYQEASKEFAGNFDSTTLTSHYTMSNNKVVYVKIVMETVRTMTRSPAVLEFAEDNEDEMRIIIVHNILQQAYKHLIKIKGVEIFWIFEFYNDLFSNKLIPKFRLLNSDETQAVLTEYKIRLRDLPKMDKCDFVVRYMGYKVGNLVEVQRPSITSGVSVAYRVVVDAHVDKLFAT